MFIIVVSSYLKSITEHACPLRNPRLAGESVNSVSVNRRRFCWCMRACSVSKQHLKKKKRNGAAPMASRWYKEFKVSRLPSAAVFLLIPLDCQQRALSTWK